MTTTWPRTILRCTSCGQPWMELTSSTQHRQHMRRALLRGWTYVMRWGCICANTETQRCPNCPPVKEQS